MKLDPSILDDRIETLTREYSETLALGDEERRRARAFVLLATSLVLDVPTGEALASLTAGGEALGLDALHMDDPVGGQFVVTLVHGHHRRESEAVPAVVVERLLQTVRLVLDPDLDGPSSDSPAWGRLEEIRSIVRDGHRPVVRVVTAGNGPRWGTEAEELVREARLPESVVWEHLGPVAMAEMMQPASPIEDDLRLVGESMVESFESCRVLRGRVSVTELARLYQAHGDALLDRDIRHRLGRRSDHVDERIGATLRSESRRADFHLFGNGVVLACTSLRRDADDRITLKDLRVIKGGQTWQSVSRVVATSPELDLSSASVAVRIYEVRQPRSGWLHEVTRALNERNPVTLRDPLVDDVVQERLERGLEELGYVYLRHRDRDRPADARAITPTEAAEAVLAVWCHRPHLARFHRDRFFGRYYAEIFADGRQASQVALAVELLRLVRARTAALQEPPRFAFHAEHLMAMLMGDELAGMGELELGPGKTALEQLVDEYFLYERGLLRVRLVLALSGIDEDAVSQQRLASAFRHGEIVGRARDADAVGMEVADRVVERMQRVESLEREATEAFERARGSNPSDPAFEDALRAGEHALRTAIEVRGEITPMDATIAETMVGLAQLPTPAGA